MKRFLFMLFICLSSCDNENFLDDQIIIYGCNDSSACNYDELATADDGSCAYAQENFDCDGNCLLEEDCSGNCNNMCLDIHSVFKQLSELSLDENGYYHFDYPDNLQQNPSDYGTVYYSTSLPMQRIGWMSTDTFYVEHMGQIIAEPVINFSTYSGDDGEGQQLFYVNPTLISDTLDIYGYYFYYPEIIDSVKVIID